MCWLGVGFLSQDQAFLWELGHCCAMRENKGTGGLSPSQERAGAGVAKQHPPGCLC